MKKTILLFALAVMVTAGAWAQSDVIITRKGEEIKASVVDVNINNVRYQANGQVFTLPRSEVFAIMIKSDDTSEAQPQPQPQQVYEQPQQTYVQPQLQSVQPQQTYAQPQQQYAAQSADRQPEAKDQVVDFNPGRFGLDYGIGGMNFGKGSDSYFGQDFAINYTRMFIPYVGWNIFDIRTSLIKNGSVSEPNDQTRFGSLQIMTGVRGVYPLLKKNNAAIISPFAAFKLGYGVFLNNPEKNVPAGLAMDISVGVEFFSSAYVAFAYNLQNLTKDLKEDRKLDGEVNYFSFRIGYQF
jgi:hypothetical protein